MKLDRAGINFIKESEGLRLSPYRCDAKKWTIGWGHTEGVTKDSPEITTDQAEKFFREDAQKFENAVSKYVSVPLTQNEFNALVSLAFNAGVGRLISSTLIRKLNLGDRQGCAKEFLRWIYVDVNPDPEIRDMQPDEGLLKRRKKEMEIFLSDFNEKRERTSGS